MSAFAQAADEEDGDMIDGLRAENEQLRRALLLANDTLVKVSQAGAHHARAAECLRETVIRWAARAEQAEGLLESIGAGVVGSTVARQDHSERRLNMAPPVMTPIAQRKLDSLLTEGYTISGYSIYHERKHQHGFVTGAGLVGWWKPDGVEYPQPQGEQEPVAWMREDGKLALNDGGMFSSNWKPLYTHPQNLNCKSNQARLATLWGYVKEQPPRRPLTDQQINDHRLALAYDSEDLPDPWDFKQGVRAAERAHGIGGEK